MTSPVTFDQAIHTRVPSSLQAGGANGIIEQLKVLIANLPKLILEQVVEFIKEKTGIDLSGILTLLDTIGDALGLGSSGGLLNWVTNIIAFFQSIDFTDPDFDPIDAILTFIEDVLIPNGIHIPVIDQIVNALSGGSSTGNPLPMIGTLLEGLAKDVSSASNAVDGAWAQIQKMGGLILQVIQELEETPLLVPVDLLGGIWFWVGGLWNSVKQSNSISNPAHAASENRITALEQAMTVLGQPSRFDDFNGDTLSATKWGAISTFSQLVVSGSGYVKHDGSFRVSEYTETMPATAHYGVQAASVDLAYGRSRLLFQANSTFTNMACVEVDRSGSSVIIRLGTLSTPNGTITEVDEHMISTGGFKNADVIRGEVDEGAVGGPLYTALLNNTVVGSWQDTASVLGTGSSHRHLALATNVSGISTFPGCGWDVFSHADITS